ncbi:hypothetical protein QZH41_001787 [Actinostola sp. cb2023]|nr:hypothetical protein QZH41_001787 [Actinostola sp. cb2023]
MANKENERKELPATIVAYSEEEMAAFKESTVAKNTKKSTETSIRRFKSWYEEKHGIEPDLNTVSKKEAPQLLKHFFLEIRQTGNDNRGKEYEPGTLQTYRNGLRRYFLERPCPPAIDNFDIEKSSGLEFQEVADMLSTKKKNLKKQGLGNQPNAAQPVEKEDVEKLWSSGAVGLKNPRKLIHLVWWNNVTHLGMRGVKEHYDCQIQDFTITDQYIEYNELQTKNRQGDEGCARKRARKYTNKIWRTDGGEQDPYRAFVEYVTHRPKSDDANVPDNFYLTPIDKTTSEVWYKKCPIGKNTLAKFMKTIASTAELTAHSTHSTNTKTTHHRTMFTHNTTNTTHYTNTRPSTYTKFTTASSHLRPHFPTNTRLPFRTVRPTTPHQYLPPTPKNTHHSHTSTTTTLPIEPPTPLHSTTTFRTPTTTSTKRTNPSALLNADPTPTPLNLTTHHPTHHESPSQSTNMCHLMDGECDILMSLIPDHLISGPPLTHTTNQTTDTSLHHPTQYNKPTPNPTTTHAPNTPPHHSPLLSKPIPPLLSIYTSPPVKQHPSSTRITLCTTTSKTTHSTPPTTHSTSIPHWFQTQPSNSRDPSPPIHYLTTTPNKHTPHTFFPPSTAPPPPPPPTQPDLYHDSPPISLSYDSTPNTFRPSPRNPSSNTPKPPTPDNTLHTEPDEPLLTFLTKLMQTRNYHSSEASFLQNRLQHDNPPDTLIPVCPPPVHLSPHLHLEWNNTIHQTATKLTALLQTHHQEALHSTSTDILNHSRHITHLTDHDTTTTILCLAEEQINHPPTPTQQPHPLHPSNHPNHTSTSNTKTHPRQPPYHRHTPRNPKDPTPTSPHPHRRQTTHQPRPLLSIKTTPPIHFNPPSHPHRPLHKPQR